MWRKKNIWPHYEIKIKKLDGITILHIKCLLINDYSITKVLMFDSPTFTSAPCGVDQVQKIFSCISHKVQDSKVAHIQIKQEMISAVIDTRSIILHFDLKCHSASSLFTAQNAHFKPACTKLALWQF